MKCQHELIIDNFSYQQPNIWVCTHDVVMGGVSSADFILTDKDIGIFRGKLSLENAGGFVSVKKMVTLDLSDYRSVLIKARGSSKRVYLTLQNRGMRHSFRHILQITDQWQVHELALKDFVAYFRGKKLPESPPLNLAAIKHIGLLMADQQAGYFHLEFDFIKAV